MEKMRFRHYYKTVFYGVQIRVASNQNRRLLATDFKNPILWGSKSSIWTISIFIFISSLDFALNRGPILSDFPVAQNRYCIVCQAFMSNYMKQRERVACSWKLEAL